MCTPLKNTLLRVPYPGVSEEARIFSLLVSFLDIKTDTKLSQ